MLASRITVEKSIINMRVTCWFFSQFYLTEKSLAESLFVRNMESFLLHIRLWSMLYNLIPFFERNIRFLYSHFNETIHVCKCRVRCYLLWFTLFNLCCTVFTISTSSLVLLIFCVATCMDELPQLSDKH